MKNGFYFELEESWGSRHHGLVHKADLSNKKPAVSVIFQGLSFSIKKTPKKQYFEILSCRKFMSSAVSNEASFDFQFSTMLGSDMSD